MLDLQSFSAREVAYSAGDLELLLYSVPIADGELQWVCWHRGASAFEAANRLFSLRFLTDIEGEELAYDFARGAFVDPTAEPEAAWIIPEVCLDHSGGVILRFGGDQRGNPSGLGEDVIRHPTNRPLTLTEITRGADFPPKVEVRSRSYASTPWRSRMIELRTKRTTDVKPAVGWNTWNSAGAKYGGMNIQ